MLVMGLFMLVVFMFLGADNPGNKPRAGRSRSINWRSTLDSKSDLL